MPFKSEAQRKLFHAMADRGEISKQKVHEWERKTKNKKNLPEYVSEKKSEYYDIGVKLALTDAGLAPVSPTAPSAPHALGGLKKRREAPSLAGKSCR